MSVQGDRPGGAEPLRKEDTFSRHLSLAAAKCGDGGWVLILLGADDDCPATLGPEILARARRVVPHRSVSVVLANREYEAWFRAAAQSLHGHRGIRFDPDDAVDPDLHRDAKNYGWATGWRAEPIVPSPTSRRSRRE